MQVREHCPRSAGCVRHRLAGEITAQYEGVARRISSTELGAYQDTDFRKFTDGPARLKWEGITYYLVAPKWIRYSDYNQSPPEIVELKVLMNLIESYFS
jgi:hypothetical protein